MKDESIELVPATTESVLAAVAESQEAIHARYQHATGCAHEGMLRLPGHVCADTREGAELERLDGELDKAENEVNATYQAYRAAVARADALGRQWREAAQRELEARRP